MLSSASLMGAVLPLCLLTSSVGYISPLSVLMVIICKKCEETTALMSKLQISTEASCLALFIELFYV